MARGGIVGLIAGDTLVLSAVAAWWVRVPDKVVAGIMAFGAGVLISALAFEPVDEAVRQGGAVPTTAGFLAGAVIYVSANAALDRHAAAGIEAAHHAVDLAVLAASRRINGGVQRLPPQQRRTHPDQLP